MLGLIVGLHYKLRGREYLDAAVTNGPCIIACKHQSAFDTIFISLYLKDVVIILKEQLAYIPFFGYYLKKLGSIFIDRENKTSAIRDLMKKCRDAIADNRSLFIFPEGTRTRPGERIPYQRGISLLYRDLNVPVVPVALNTGVFWGKKSLFKRPGEIIIDIQPPILPGLERDIFMENLQNTIESSSNSLLENSHLVKKKTWIKKIITWVFIVFFCSALTCYFGAKTFFDHKIEQAGIKFSKSKVHFGFYSLPSYELTNVSTGSSLFPNVKLIAEKVNITPTGRKSFTIEIINSSAQLFENIFITVGKLEAFLDLPGCKPKTFVDHVPRIYSRHIGFENIILKVGTFTSKINFLEASYVEEGDLDFSCSTPHSPLVDVPILNIKSHIYEQSDKTLTGEFAVQSTFCEDFIKALEQQGMISSDNAVQLLKKITPIKHEKNPKLKQIIIPIS